MRSTIAGLASVLMLGTTPGLWVWPASDPPAARHQAQPAPTQRWGTATAQDHIVGSSGNRTEPTTLRALYPLHQPSPPPPVPHNTARVVSVAPAPVRGYDPQTSTELPDQRGTHQSTYANADGTLTSVFSTAPVNYQRPDGRWMPIDPRLVPADGSAGGWHNAADAVDIRLADRASASTLARLDLDADHAVAFSLYGAANAAGHASGDTVNYPAALPGVDVRIQTHGGGVKETLVLRSAAAPHSFLFPLRLTGLSARVVAGQVVLTDSAGAVRATFPAGFMTDSNKDAPATSTGVRYRLVTLDDGQALQVTVDTDWLADPARVFPVLVDPSVSSDGPDSSLVVQGSTSRAGGSELLVGPVGGSPAASYVRFGGLVSQLAHHTIYGAQLQVVGFDSPSCRPRSVSVHPVTQSWSSTSSFSYPGPSVGSALASKSFAYGFVAFGHSSSACPPQGTLFNLGDAGRKLVQGWVDGSPNNGLALRASATDSLAWKRFAGPSTVNAPKLYVTHSPYNAKYAIPDPVPEPPVLQNQSGQIKVTVTNRSAEAWSPTSYYLAYRAYNADTGKSVTQQRSANLPGTVARGAKITLTATIKALPPGTYFLDFTMVHTGGPVFTDEQVPPARIVLTVIDIPPVLEELFPPNGYSAQTLTPQLWARALDIDAPPGSALSFKFEVCDRNDAGDPVNCTTTPYQTDQAWTVPAGMLSWSKTYLWRAFVKDATTEVPSPYSALVTSVPQPAVTSRVAGAPYGTQDREFDPQIGNFSTVAMDATVTTVGPALNLMRTYNSLDPRTDLAFGAGWSTQYDMRLVPDDDGSGNVVVTYSDGQEVRFGQNPDGTYAPPQGRRVSLTTSGSTWVLADQTGTRYTFSGTGRLSRITDAAQHSLVLTYSFSNGRLAQAQVSNSQTNTAGRALHFVWTGSHVTSVSTDPVAGQPLTWTYQYAGDLLASVCAPDATCTTYTYADGSHYRTAVLDDRPESYWRLGESGGDSAASQLAVNLGKDHATYHNVTLGATGGLAGTDDTAATLNGTSSYVELPDGTVKKSRDAAVEVWFKASLTGSGGPLVGYQDKALTDTSTVGVPLLYVGTDGKLHGQFWTGTVAPITSTKSVNDGLWHQAVLSVMGSTQTLYLDGKVTGTATGGVDASLLTVNQVGAAYATSPGSWPGWGTTSRRYFRGTIDEVSLYAHPLGPGAVAAHHAYATAAHQLTSVVLPSGNTASEVSYDAATDRVATYTDHNGGTWTVGAPTVYGGNDDLRRGVEVRDPTDRPYLYEYDALAGRMIRSGSPTGLVIKDEDRSGATPTPSPTPSPTPTETCTTPDPGDPQFCTTIPPTSDGPVFDGHTLDGMAIRTFSYDERGFQTGITNENGDTVTLGYDDRGNVTSKQTCRALNDCHTEYRTYPAAPVDSLDPRDSLATAFRDARSSGPTDNRFLTTYTYTSTGDLATQTNPDGSIVRHTYTIGIEPAVGGGAVPPGLLSTTTDARGAVTRYGYYQNGDLATVTEPSGRVTTFDYDELGRTVSQTEISDAFPAGITTTFSYDALSRVVSTTAPATTDAVSGQQHQARTTNTYDADGRVTATTVSDVLGGDSARTTSYVYDDHGRAVQVTDAEGNETSYGYDRNGNRTSMVDPNGNHYEYGYTARNKLAEVRLVDWTDDPPGVEPPPDGVLILNSYAYDFAGRMVRHTDAMGHQVEYAYYHDDLLQSTTLKNLHNPDGTTRDYVLESDSYDGAGNLVRQVAGNGTVVTEHTIDPVGQVTATVMDPDGLARRTTFDYDANGNVTSTATSGNASNVPWPVPTAPQTVTYTYDLAGNQTSQTVTDGVTSHVTTYGYDQRGLMVSSTDPRGNVAGADPAAFTTTFGYDELGRQTTITGPAVSAESDGNPAQTVRPTSTVGYDTFGEPVSTRDELGNVSTTGYDRLGRPITVSAPAYTPPGTTTPIVPTSTTGYDPNGNVTSTTDPLGNVTRYSYDRLNRMTVRDEPASTNDERAVWHYTYTRTGEVLSVTDPTGARVESTYDELDRRVTMTQVERRPVADNLTTRYTFDDAGNLTSLVSPSGATVTSAYDAVGEPVTLTDPSGVSTALGYDFAGRQVRIADELGRTSRSDYDVLGQLTRDVDLDPTGATLREVTYTHDPAGNLVEATDPLGHTTTYSYDAMNQLVGQTEPVSDTSSITTSFGYDAAGNRTRYTDGRGNSTIYTVNPLGLPESVIVPATTAQPDLADRTWTTGYDAAGEPVSLVAPGGVTRSRVYDAAGRLTVETGAGAETPTTQRSLGYDLADRLTSVSAPGGTDTYTYDDRGDLLTSSGPSGLGNYAYDADGNMTVRTDAAGTANYTYTDGRLATLTDGITNTTQTLGYDVAGQLSTVDYGAGRVRTFGYDDLGRPSSDTLTNAAGQTVASIGYGYDLNDRMVRKTTTGTAGAADNTYGYDQAGRLVSWNNGTTTTTYAWDASGNRVQAGNDTATFDERDRLVSSGDTTYSYTARGTLGSTASSGLPDPFSFDAFDRLVTEGATGYAYDGLDRIASRDDQPFAYAGLSSDPVADGTATYARGPVDELLAVSAGTDQRLTLSDEHGDLVGDFDPADTTLDTLTDSAAFDPFGQVVATSDAGGTVGNLGYQGDYTDPDTGQVNMAARFYDPGTGTFDSADSAVYSTGASILANPYLYGAADPLDNTDPTGHWPCLKCLLHKGAHLVSTAYHVTVNTISTGLNYAWSGVKTAFHYGLAGAKWLYNKGKEGLHILVNTATHVINRVRKMLGSTANWAKQKLAAAKRAAVAQARRVTQVARQAVAWAAKHNPIPVITAAVKPLYSGLKKVVSAAAHLPAQVVAVTRDVVKDVTKGVKVIYQKAVDTAGDVIEDVSDAVKATGNFIEAHAATIAGIAAGTLVGIGCGIAVGWTGAGAVACGALAGVVGSVVHDLVEGGHSFGDIATNALIGGTIGALTGGLGSIGGAAV
ncbi:MAG TPA: LamG-like jellyroll fold domain-containing protein, partial [Mycobacteriales bacterium]